jgi:hypothetical protein
MAPRSGKSYPRTAIFGTLYYHLEQATTVAHALPFFSMAFGLTEYLSVHRMRRRRKKRRRRRRR